MNPGLIVDCDGDVWIRRDINKDEWVWLTDPDNGDEYGPTTFSLDRLQEAWGPLRVYELAYTLPDTS